LAVLGNEEFEISIAGEIVVNEKYDFYTYEAKYLDEHSIFCQIPAEIPDDVFRNIQEIARRACVAVNVK
jgi:D-alanine-D-alanine ligase